MAVFEIKTFYEFTILSNFDNLDDNINHGRKL